MKEICNNKVNFGLQPIFWCNQGSRSHQS